MAISIGSPGGHMPRIASLLVLLLLPLVALSQYKPPLHENGLIYDEATIRTLRHICDSMQQRFRSEPPGPPCYAPSQTIGSYIRLRGTIAALEEVGRVMDSGATFDEVAGEFGEMMIDSMREIALTRHQWQNRNQWGMTYTAALTDAPYEPIWVDQSTSVDDSNTVISPIGWFHDIRLRWTEDSIKEMTALYVMHPLERHRLPERYARLVQFVDFMVDTTTALKLVNDKDEQTPGAFDEVMEAIHEVIDPPEETTPSPSSFSAYLERHESWIDRKMARIDEAMRDTAFADKVRAAAKTGIADMRSDPDLEFLVERYISKDLALELTRRRRLIRMCGSDGADVAQYNAIARLAAEAGRWDIFPRAHFRIICPPYAGLDETAMPGERKTYVKELEAIGLDLPAMMIGQAIRIDEPNGKHLGIWNPAVATAMAESEMGEEYEKRLLAMIDDPELDPPDG